MKTNRTLKLITLTAAIFGFAATSFGQSSLNPVVGATATASATIITPISIANTANLQFGNIIANGTGGSVTVASSTGTRTAAGVDFPSLEGSVSAAAFNVTGFSGASYSVTLPSADLVIKNPANNEMTVSDFESSSTNSYTITGGSDILKVGAKLTVAASQAEGIYSGTFTVTVNYN